MSKTKTHIAFFLPSLYGGGAERVFVDLMNALVEKDIKVDLLLAKAEGAYLNKISSLIRIINFNVWPTSTSLLKLANYLHRESPNILLSSMIESNLVAVLAKRLSQASTRIIIRESNTASLVFKHTKDYKIRLKIFLRKYFYPWADEIIAVSQGVAKDVAQTANISCDKITIINNPTVTSELMIKANEPLDHPWFKSNQPPVILGVGRLIPQKDFPNLIKAFEKVRQSYIAKLMILGEGSERNNLEALVRHLGLEKEVAMPGFVENPFAYMKQASLFVLSSAWEGLPNVLIQAMACGTPVIATDCQSGPREILANGEYGKLVPINNPTALAETIVKALQNKSDTNKAQNHILNFNFNKIFQQYLDLFKRNI